MAVSPPKLILIEPSGTQRELTLTKFPFTIGRQAGNDLLLRDSRISREHAAILSENSAFVIEDRGSRHGTFVNGTRVDRRVLQPNDRIEFGPQSGYALVFTTGESPLPELLKRVENQITPPTPTRELRNLGLLLEVGRVLTAGLTLDEILATLVDASLHVVDAERGFLFLKNDAGELQFCAGRDRHQRTLDAREAVSRSVIEEAVRQRRDIVLTDSHADQRFGGQQSIVKLELHSIICLPLRRMATLQTTSTTVIDNASNVLGVLYLDSRKPVTAFSDVDRQMLQVLATEAAAIIDNARLFTAARAKERLDQELAIARSIQQALLPKGFKQYDFFHVTGLTVPCEEVGGDYFDLVEEPENRFGVVVADVSGKGVSAALLTSMIQGAFATTASLGQAPEQIARNVNRFICQRSEVNRYATLFYGVLDAQGVFSYVNAGHLPPFLVRCSKGRAIEKLPAESFPLGLFVEADYRPAQCQLAPGDTLLLYTDGITEALDPAGEFFGMERLEKTLAGLCGGTVDEISQGVLDAVSNFTAGSYQADDITLMVVRYEGKP